jgi:hypothetical protein
MINITLTCQEKNICKKNQNFHHYLTWFLAPIFILSLGCYSPFLPNEYQMKLTNWGLHQQNIISWPICIALHSTTSTHDNHNLEHETISQEVKRIVCDNNIIC